ncbi:putative metalloprotease CJM1_0395 family protein [Halomonas sp.]|uniref:putative metalloprotease CJM1_0395 family protein n=1 Tax=Halomonas sp. TaxID=1486246 RepID=UPI00298E3CD9|nr:putative metalloprotease CJM1_0395 family protein [Halomonas sp.]MDW7748275.1 putative metalloprotease CJM1_0395 family protein [Halomonas sp.]
MFASTVVGPVPVQFGVQPQPSATTGAPESQGVSSSASPTDKPTQDRDAERSQRPGESEAATKPNGETLSDVELRQIEQMKVTDQEVRRHELAHQVAGGAYTGGPSYTYERGPDGNRYVVAGEVPIDYGPVQGDPQATIGKMQQVISAALAPADPSPKDHQVAARARGYMMAAQLEVAQQQSEMDSARDGASVTAEVRGGNRAPSSDDADAAAATRPDATQGRQISVDTALSQYDIIARTASSGAQEALQSLA